MSSVRRFPGAIKKELQYFLIDFQHARYKYFILNQVAKRI